MMTAAVEIVMEYYFKPQRAQLKQALQRNMPNMLTFGVAPPAEAAAVLRTAISKNWKATIEKH